MFCTTCAEEGWHNSRSASTLWSRCHITGGYLPCGHMSQLQLARSHGLPAVRLSELRGRGAELNDLHRHQRQLPASTLRAWLGEAATKGAALLRSCLHGAALPMLLFASQMNGGTFGYGAMVCEHICNCSGDTVQSSMGPLAHAAGFRRAWRGRRTQCAAPVR